MRHNHYPKLSSEEIGSAIQAFMAECCPACDREKERLADPFCAACFDSLPAELQAKLSDRDNFIEASHPAMRYLKAHRKEAAHISRGPSNRIRGECLDS